MKPKVIVEEDVKDEEQAEDNEKYDYIVDLKAKSASLTQKGIKKAEEEFEKSYEKLKISEYGQGDIVFEKNGDTYAYRRTIVKIWGTSWKSKDD